jgi:hypothetical protein
MGSRGGRGGRLGGGLGKARAGQSAGGRRLRGGARGEGLGGADGEAGRVLPRLRRVGTL